MVKMAILPKANLWIQYNLYQNSSWLFSKIDKLMLKFIWKVKGPRTDKTILRKKTKMGNLPSISKQYKTTISKTICYRHKDIFTDQWNGTDCLEIKTRFYGQPILALRVLRQFNAERIVQLTLEQHRSELHRYT